MRRKALPHLFALLALGLFLAVPLKATGAEESDGHHEAAASHESAEHEAHDVSLWSLKYPAVNFTIYCIIIFVYVIPAMREGLQRRQSELTSAQSEASEALARAEREVAAKRSQLASLPAEAEGIRRDLVAMAERQAQRLVAQAEETGKRRLADAALVAEQERRRALDEVRAEVARIATGLAERNIRAKLTSEDQQTFVRRFLKDATAQ